MTASVIASFFDATTGVSSSLMVCMSAISMATKRISLGMVESSIARPSLTAVAMLMSWAGMPLSTVDSKSAISKMSMVPGSYIPVNMASAMTTALYPLIIGRSSSPPMASWKQSTSGMPLRPISSYIRKPMESSVIMGLPRPISAILPLSVMIVWRGCTACCSNCC